MHVTPRVTFVTWAGLVAVTLLGFGAKAVFGAEGAALVVLSAAGVKALLVAFSFMELKAAHPAWKAGFAALVMTLVMALCLTRGGA